MIPTVRPHLRKILDDNSVYFLSVRKDLQSAPGGDPKSICGDAFQGGGLLQPGAAGLAAGDRTGW